MFYSLPIDNLWVSTLGIIYFDGSRSINLLDNIGSFPFGEEFSFDIFRTWHFLNCINFSFVHLTTSFRNFMSQDNTFINHKVALLPIQDKISLLTSLQNSINVA